MNEEWIKVCGQDDLVPGSGICALLDHQQIAIFQENTTDNIYAISNYDPICEANVLSRGIIGSMGDKLVVASPLYKQHFCLESGQCLEHEDITIDVFELRLQDGNVFIKLKR